MFSAATATIAGAMRPGLITGWYPERRDEEVQWPDRAFKMLQGGLARLAIRQTASLRRISAAVGQQGQSLTALDDRQLANMAVDLRRRLHTQGLRDALGIQAFALIREMASRTIGKRHYDEQVMGGWVMLQGRLAEMETGEGKTLAATLAAATAALAGIPVHVLTVNEYLVQRDAKSMGPLYQALGLTVGYVTQEMTPEKIRAAYDCDVTYCTNKQVAFDYLRDRLLLGQKRNHLSLQLETAWNHQHRQGQLLLRGLCFAIIDEADSVLIDEANTPLILTRNADNRVEHALYAQILDWTRQLIDGHDFFIDTPQGQVQLSLAGQEKLTRLQLPGQGIWQTSRSREELVTKALHALHILRRDRDYLVTNGKILIIDANTGRTMPDRSWERGLHQFVEAKEGCALTYTRELLGRLTYQRFFSRYLRLGGMSGTLREIRTELWSVYGLRVQRIPLHRPSRRRQLPTQVHSRAEQKWAAIVASIEALQRHERPVLIGTGSVADSECLGQRLSAAGVNHWLLNARQDRNEAEIIAMAGQKGQVTVATNMAGRGTDIPLGAGVPELGGLHVIVAGRNPAGRIDRQLYGRCARQGDPGSHQAILSIDDELVQQHIHQRLIKFFGWYANTGGMFRRRLMLSVQRIAQRRAENIKRRTRRQLMNLDRQTCRMLAFSGDME
jgi:preprotein translocase subunit SecA